MKDETLNQPTVFVLFGGSGDLAWRKLVPALFSLYQEKRLPQQFAILGLGRSNNPHEKYRQHLYEGVQQFSRLKPQSAAEWKPFADNIQFVRDDFSELSAFKQLAGLLNDFDKKWHAKANHIFYMATPPQIFGEIAGFLGEVGLGRNRKQARLVVEKPLGHDLDSAIELNQSLRKSFKEYQIFRIDHYLGKETVQNLMAFRFANPMFEPIWNRAYIDNVMITVAEQVDVGHRADYYETSGALRDMIQNHLMQLLCLVAMEPPVSFEADEVRNKKVDVLHAIRPIPAEQVNDMATRGQYGAGKVGGKTIVGYREAEGVSPDSNTETYAAVKLHVDNWRWQGVPFYLRTGKALSQQLSEINIQFKAVPHQSFPTEASSNWEAGSLRICIQPTEGIVMNFQAKRPGTRMQLQPVAMQFCYEDAFQAVSPEAYETLLWDVMIGDQTLFMRADQVEASWAIFMPILNVWTNTPASDFPNYEAGSEGPESAKQMIAKDGRTWLPLAPLVPESDQGKDKSKKEKATV